MIEKKVKIKIEKKVRVNCDAESKLLSSKHWHSKFEVYSTNIKKVRYTQFLFEDLF